MKVGLNKAWSVTEVGGKSFTEDIPSLNYTTLIKNGELADPFFDKNEKDSLAPSLSDWRYEKKFDAPASLLKYDKISLVLTQIDTVADVVLNGKKLASVSNCHVAYRVEVGDIIKQTGNLLEVYIYSPVKYIQEKQAADAMPKNMNGLSGAPHIRKPQCHFGWDWGPTLPPSGLSGEVFLEGNNKGRILNLTVLQTHSQSQVDLKFEVETEDFCEYDKKILVEITAPNGEKNRIDLSKTNLFTVNNPELWWCNGLGGQLLYEVAVTLFDGDAMLDSSIKRIGLRTITLDRNNDKFGQNFCFYLNGKRIFAKGANWIPPDSFITRATPDVLEYYIAAIKDCNMNMVRVWGGGYYETDLFYDLCDENGILVWQDFCFACAPYPFYDETFLESVKQEIKYNVLRIKHHASLALFCGNNEIEAMSLGWKLYKKLTLWTEKFFYHILPEELSRYDNAIPFINGSPTGLGYMNSVASDKAGDTHLWHVWHGLQPLTYYRKRFTRFCSEFGLESLPSMDAIRSFTDKTELSLSDDTFMAHQKCASGNNKMLYYMATRFNIPKKFEDLVYFTGLIQKECVVDATEHWRRNSGRCNGSIFWQLNDCWPVSSWSSIDYLGKFKALQYQIKHTNAPLSVSLLNNKSKVDVFIINDTIAEKRFNLKLKLQTFDGKVLYDFSKDFEAEATSAKNIKSINCKKFLHGVKLKNCVLSAELLVGDEVISQKTTLFAPEKCLNLAKSNFKVDVSKTDDKATISILSPSFARSVMLDVKGVSQPFSDNYFDILPNATKTVTLKTSLTAEQLKTALIIKHVGDVLCETSKFKNFLLRAKIYLIPINIANNIVYRFM